MKPNVILEPLVDRWFAWSYLISPATAAMYTTNLHAKLMESFISAPQVHIEAASNPALRGGPYMHHDGTKVGAVKELLDETKNKRRLAFVLADAIIALDNLLAAEAQGYSMEPLYQKVPEPLKGYVELYYDLNNRPAARFMEALLYKSKYNASAAQSIFLCPAVGDYRHFVFSTPRLDSEGGCFLNLPFSHSGLDELCMARYSSTDIERLGETLGVRNFDNGWSSLFTEKSPRKLPAPYQGSGVRIRYFGHACVLIQTSGVSILTDPVIGQEQSDGVPRYSYYDLPDRIDYVLITHSHQDHFMLETLLQLRHKIGVVVVPRNNGGALVDPSLKLALESMGFPRVHEISEMEALRLPTGSITALPFLGEHADLNIWTKLAYAINIEGTTTLAVADSNNVEPALYKYIHEIIGDVDVLFVGMECDGAPLSWLYGPLLTRPLSRKIDQSRRFDGSDCAKAMQIVRQFHPKQVYVYAMGQEPWLSFLTTIEYTPESRPIVESDKLIEACRENNIIAERLFGQKELHLPTC